MREGSFLASGRWPTCKWGSEVEFWKRLINSHVFPSRVLQNPP